MQPDCPLKPLYDNIIIKQDAAEDTTKAGIVVAASAVRPKNTGTILATGEGRLCTTLAGRYRPPEDSVLGFALNSCHVEPLRVKVGDRVMFSLHAGNEIEYEVPGQETPERVIILSEDEIVAILPPLQPK